MKIKFVSASPDEAEALSNLAIESKGHWGYSQDQLKIWRKDLKIEEEYISKNLVRMILVDGKLAGFFAISKNNDDGDNYLDHLWLLSKVIGFGVGKLAFEKIKEICRSLKIEKFVVISDPNAEGFYLKQGCNRVGKVESKPPGRMLPKLIYRIKETKHNQTQRANEHSSSAC